jgi:hypothetical protein
MLPALLVFIQVPQCPPLPTVLTLPVVSIEPNVLVTVLEAIYSCWAEELCIGVHAVLGSSHPSDNCLFGKVHQRADAISCIRHTSASVLHFTASYGSLVVYYLGRNVCLADCIAEQRLLGRDSCPRRSTAGKVGLHQERPLSLGMRKDNLAVEMPQPQISSNLGYSDMVTSSAFSPHERHESGGSQHLKHAASAMQPTHC